MTTPQTLLSDENLALMSATTLTWPRKDVSREWTRNYWTDVHSVLFAHCGMTSYWQHHFGAPLNLEWGFASSVEQQPTDAIPAGVAELHCDTEQALAAFMGSSLLRQHVYYDEQNLVERSCAFFAGPGGTKLFRSTGAVATPNGDRSNRDDAVSRYFVGIRPAVGIELSEFRAAVLLFSQRFADGPALLVRVQLLEEYNPAQWTSEGVEHELPWSFAYGAMMHLAFPRDEDLAVWLRASPMADLSGDSLFHAVHVFPVTTITCVAGGRPTLVGLRGYRVACNIWDLAAEVGMRPDVLKHLYVGAAERES